MIAYSLLYFGSHLLVYLLCLIQLSPCQVSAAARARRQAAHRGSSAATSRLTEEEADQQEEEEGGPEVTCRAVTNLREVSPSLRMTHLG